MNYEVISHIIAIMYIVFMISLFGASVYLFILVVKALKKYAKFMKNVATRSLNLT